MPMCPCREEEQGTGADVVPTRPGSCKTKLQHEEPNRLVTSVDQRGHWTGDSQCPSTVRRPDHDDFRATMVVERMGRHEHFLSRPALCEHTVHTASDTKSQLSLVDAPAPVVSTGPHNSVLVMHLGVPVTAAAQWCCPIGDAKARSFGFPSQTLDWGSSTQLVSSAWQAQIGGHTTKVCWWMSG